MNKITKKFFLQDQIASALGHLPKGLRKPAGAIASIGLVGPVIAQRSFEHGAQLLKDLVHVMDKPPSRYTLEDIEKTMALTGLGVGLGAPAGLPAGAEGAGILRGMSKTKAREVRSLMRTEAKSRGPLTTTSSDPNWFSQILRGTWFHGRGTYPKEGKTFKGSREQSRNLGEPTGISLTADAEKSTSFLHLSKPKEKIRNDLIAQRQKVLLELVREGESPKLRKKYNTLVDAQKKLEQATYKPGRVLPEYKGIPEDKILQGWKGGRDEKILRDTYAETFEKLFPKDVFEEVKVGLKAKGEVVSTFLRGQIGNNPELRKVFNESLTANLQKKGYKGLLYSPKRLNEYELKIFDPADVRMLDRREVLSPVSSIRKFDIQKSKTPQMRLWKSQVDESSASLKDIYKDIDLGDLLLKSEARAKQPTGESLASSFNRSYSGNALKFDGKYPDFDVYQFTPQSGKMKGVTFVTKELTEEALEAGYQRKLKEFGI